MTIYGIASKHDYIGGGKDGSAYATAVLRAMNGWSPGEFRPFFTSRDEAEKHLAGIDWSYGLSVQEFELKD